MENDSSAPRGLQIVHYTIEQDTCVLGSKSGSRISETDMRILLSFLASFIVRYDDAALTQGSRGSVRARVGELCRHVVIGTSSRSPTNSQSYVVPLSSNTTRP